MAEVSRVIYWDASAILACLFQDAHSETARQWTKPAGVHLISSLGYAETYAVIARIKRTGQLADILIESAIEIFQAGPWRYLNFQPEPSVLLSLAMHWRLRGADLWHLACAKQLQKHIPEVRLLTFDQRLLEAVEGEGIAIE